ncbi:stage II sporulation protein Q [Alicyclobacillus hesperidum]|uniref:Stage II sporulation protein Q n=1 Tax=Alicyclobacillus hesperidum TaxID=89784 RepID=A0A1H2XAW6_9BACL|nr:M23 family metallopeptidase [Alicyclobacillus hesperidum]SDW89980.1 stage II sporulation protein Q [Alicyclobacillus hesperidum]
MDDKQHPNQENQKPDAPNGRPSNAKRWMSKRWLYPAIYLGAAAVIIGLMYAKSQSGSTQTSVQPTETNTTSQTTTQTTSAGLEPWLWPYQEGTDAAVTMGFYPIHGTATQQENALVDYDNTYYPHKGIDIQAKGGQTFTVVAAQKGTVESVSNQPLYGYEVVVNSPDGYTETYQSLGSVDVKQGQSIEAGDTIGTTSTNVFEQSQGNHLYFQVNLNGSPIDPETVLPKQ